MEVLDDLMNQLVGSSSLMAAIFDANNSTSARVSYRLAPMILPRLTNTQQRQALLRRLRSGGVPAREVLFVELIGDAAPRAADGELNYRSMDPTAAEADLRQRLSFYNSAYEPLPIETALNDADTLAKQLDSLTAPLPKSSNGSATSSSKGPSELPMMVRVCSEQRHLTISGVRTYVAQRVASLLMNIRTKKKKIYFSRHG